MILEEEEIPSDWLKGVIIKLPKKGNLRECTNLRNITLLIMASTVLSKILLERVKNRVDAKLRPVHAGYLVRGKVLWNRYLYYITDLNSH